MALLDGEQQAGWGARRRPEGLPHSYTKMRRTIVVCGILAGHLLMAQSADEFDAWMRTIDDRNQSVQRNIAAKDGAAAAADAKTLQDTFKLVEEFWTKRGNAADAVELSQKGRERAADVAKSIGAKDFDAAAAQSVKMSETCTACHRLYRPLF